MKFNLRGKVKYISETIFCYKNWWKIFINRALKKKTNQIILRNGIVVASEDSELAIDLTNEIFVKNIYSPIFLPINKNDVVMDIGANIGVFSLFAANKGASKIYSVEPYKKSVEQLRKNFKANGFRLPKIITAAISDKEGTAKLYIGDIDSHSSLISNKKQKYNFVNIKTSTIKYIFNKYKIDKIDFLKIDCEGGEGKIFKEKNYDTLSKIDKISIEYHDNISQMPHSEIIKQLRNIGFDTKIIKTGKYLGYIYARKIK